MPFVVVVVVERRAGVRALDDWKPHKRGRIQSHSLSRKQIHFSSSSKQARTSGSIAILLLSAFLSRDDVLLVWKRTRPTPFLFFSRFGTLSLSLDGGGDARDGKISILRIRIINCEANFQLAFENVEDILFSIIAHTRAPRKRHKVRREEGKRR